MSYCDQCARLLRDKEALTAEVERLTEQEKRKHQTTVVQQGLISKLEAEVEAVQRVQGAMVRALTARVAELEAALKDLVRLIDEDQEEDAPPYLVDQVLDRARAALTKGESHD